MSNLEREPAEVVGGSPPAVTLERGRPMSVLSPREVPLGGPRAMTVHRTLPQRERTTIGAWCFIDHYGPDDVSISGGMRVPPHPHTGLQTVSWLFRGEVLHNDSVGTAARVRPGELNLMTAGHGISHSEYSTPETTVLHGVQLWTVLPDAARDAPPFFEHLVPRPFEFEGSTVRVFVGEFAGESTDATTFSPLLGAQIDLPASSSIELPLDAEFEHGILLDRGPLLVDGAPLAVRELGYLEPGRASVRLSATDTDARLLLLGGAPLGERIVMWWNFIGREHDEIAAFRERWQRDVIAGEQVHGRFGSVQGAPDPALPAPALPTVRLKPRG